jgi:hypothetical protein
MPGNLAGLCRFIRVKEQQQVPVRGAIVVWLGNSEPIATNALTVEF